ncbi:DUF4843 domain-containing protein [Parapedobacter deserti]|uniref:DUF4843 domain-containing protein n=1 Tax=Parapedobacter deserti TaxID=1912957 RepID=A0ABV7JJ66_9SPHI
MMNKITCIFLCAVVLFSCEKEIDARYEPSFSALNIWLGSNVQKPDSMVYNFAFRPVQEADTISFSVRLMGLPANHDREFKLIAISGDTARIKQGVHYEFPTYILPAHAYEGVYSIFIKRTDTFSGQPGRIVFGLMEDGVFRRGIQERSDIAIVLMDQFAKPAHWDIDPAPYQPLMRFFGAYSDVKFQFITTAIGRAPTFKVRYSGTPIPPDEVSYTQAQYWQNRCRTQLLQYNANNPEAPLRDEHGEIVTFP